MIKNPYLSAVLASAYIITLIVLLTFVAPMVFAEKEDTIFIPMAMLSLLVFSVCVMGYLFVAQPLMLYIDGHKKDALSFFMRTVGTFGALTLVLIVVAYLMQ